MVAIPPVFRDVDQFPVFPGVQIGKIERVLLRLDVEDARSLPADRDHPDGSGHEDLGFQVGQVDDADAVVGVV